MLQLECCFSCTTVFHLYFRSLEFQQADGLRVFITEWDIACILSCEPTQGRKWLNSDPWQPSCYKGRNYNGKLGIPTKDLQAHFVRTSISVKKYNFSYFLNIPDKPMIFLCIPTFIFVNTALEFIWSINYFQAHHAGVGGKGNKSDPKQQNIKIRIFP